MKREPVVYLMSILAALQVVVASADWYELVSDPVARGGNLFVAALTVGMTIFIRGKVTPLDSVNHKE